MLAWSLALTSSLAFAQEASSLYNNEQFAVADDTVPPNNFFYVHGSSLRVPPAAAVTDAQEYDYRLLVNNGESPNLSMLRGERYRFLVADNVGEILEQRSQMRHYGFHMWTAARDANNQATCAGAAAGVLRTGTDGPTVVPAGNAFTINMKPFATLATPPGIDVLPDGATANFGEHLLECNELAWRADVGFSIGNARALTAEDAVLRLLSAGGFSLGDIVHIQYAPGASASNGIVTAVVTGFVDSTTSPGLTNTPAGNLVVRRLSGVTFIGGAGGPFDPNTGINQVRIFKSNRGSSFNPIFDLRSSNPLLLEFQLHTQNYNGGLGGQGTGPLGGLGQQSSGHNVATNTRQPFQNRLCYHRRGYTSTRRPFDTNQIPFGGGAPVGAEDFGNDLAGDHPWVTQRNDLFPYGAPFERTGWQEVTLAVPTGTVADAGGLGTSTDLCYGMCNLYESTLWPNPTALNSVQGGFANTAINCFGVGHISVVDFSDTAPALVRTLTVRGQTVQLHPPIVTGVDPNDPSGDVYGDRTVQPALPRNQVALPYVYQPISTVVPVTIPAAGTAVTNGDVAVTVTGQNLDTTQAEFRLYPCNPVLPPCPTGALDKSECQEGRPANRNPANFGDRWLNGYPSIPKQTAGRSMNTVNLGGALDGVYDFAFPFGETVNFVGDGNGVTRPANDASQRSPDDRANTDGAGGALDVANDRWFQWSSSPAAMFPAFDAQLASTVCTCETARNQAPIIWRNGDGRLVTSGKIPASADRTENSATMTLPGSLLDNALTMNGARATGREGDFIMCPTVPFVDGTTGSETVTPGGQGLILQLRASCASDAGCLARSQTAECENAFDRNECRLATQCRDVGGAQSVCVVPETQDVCGTNLYNKVEGRCCDPANSLVYPSDVWGVDEAAATTELGFAAAPFLLTDFWFGGDSGSATDVFRNDATASFNQFQTTVSALCSLNVFADDASANPGLGAPRSLLEYQMCTFVDSMVTKGYDNLGLNLKVLAARWRKQVQQVQGRPRFPCPCTAANYPGAGNTASSALGAQSYGCALQNEQCCTFDAAGWRNDATKTLEANPLFLSLDYYQCYDTQYFGCCDDGQVYNPGLERCCALTGLQPSEVPCPCAADVDCKIPNRADKDADMFCCTQTAPQPAFYAESVATCSKFQNWEPVEDYFGIVGAGIKHHAHPTIQKLRQAEENHLFTHSTAAAYGTGDNDLSSRFGRYGRTHAAPTCPGVCIDTSYQTCCNGNVCGSAYETCCNSTCCNKFSATCVESRNQPKVHSSWMERFYGFDLEFGTEFQDGVNSGTAVPAGPSFWTIPVAGVQPRNWFRLEAFQPFRGFLGTLQDGTHPAWFASSVNYGNTYDVCTTVEYLNPIRAVMVFVAPTGFLLMSLGLLAFAFVFALRQADRSYFLTEKLLVVLAIAEAFFAWPLFFSPQFKYGIFVTLAAAATVCAAGARIKYTHAVMAVTQTVLVLWLLDPFAGSDFFTLASWKDAVTPNADFRANGLHRHITTNWLLDVPQGDVSPFPDTGAPVLDQQFSARTYCRGDGSAENQRCMHDRFDGNAAGMFVDDVDNEDLTSKASAGVQRGLPVAYEFDHVARKSRTYPLSAAASYSGNNICTAFYQGYFQLDMRLLDTERYDNYQERFFGYCSRGWTVTLLVSAGFVVMAAVLVLLLTLFEIGILTQWQRDGEWNFDPEEADMFRARDKIADLGPEEILDNE